MNPGGGGCGELRLHHYTPAWATKAKLHLKKKNAGEGGEKRRRENSPNKKGISEIFMEIYSWLTVIIGKEFQLLFPTAQVLMVAEFLNVYFCA